MGSPPSAASTRGTRLLGDEQRARASSASAAGWREHPRAAGDGVLRLQLVRPARRAPGRWSSAPASTRRTSSARSRRSTHEVGALGGDGPTPRELAEIAAVSDRLDPAHARDQRRHRRLPADRRALRSRRSTTIGGCPRCCGPSRSRVHRRPRASLSPGSRVRGDRGPVDLRAVPGAGRDDATAVFFDVDFTLIHPGPTFQGDGYREVCARHGVDVDPGALRRGRRERVVAARRRQDGSTIRSLHRLHAARSSQRMGGSGPAAGRRRAISMTSGPRAITSRCTTMCPTCCGGCMPRGSASAYLEHAPLPARRSRRTSSSTACSRAVSSSASRLHEAASEHLRGGARAGRACGRRSR